MTISAQGVRAVYLGSGSAGPFTLQDVNAQAILFEDNSEIIVTRYNTSGVASQLTITTDYTITGAGSGSAGSVTLTSVLAVGEKLVMRRMTERSQLIDLSSAEFIDNEVLEEFFDKLIRIDQEDYDRRVHMDSRHVGTGLSFPYPEATALIAWNSAGTGLENVLATNIDITAVSPFIETLIDDPDAATARATLGLTIGTHVQAWDADLDTLAGLAKTDGNFIVGNGTTWVVESGATARASLGAIGGSTGSDDNRILRSDGTGGATLQASTVTLTDAGAISGLDDITQTAPGGMWTTVSPFVNIARLDRLFVGSADTATGNFDADDQGGIIPDVATGPSYLAVHAQILSYARLGGYAIVGASRCSDQNGTASSIGISGALEGDGASDRLGWAMYSDVQHSTSYATYGLEVAVKNLGTDYNHYPYGMTAAAQGAYALWLHAGNGGVGPLPVSPPTAAMTIVGENTANTRWRKGILFEAVGLSGCDGVTGIGEAIAMARGHQISWYYAGDNLGAGITSLVDAASSSHVQYFDDNTVYWQSSTSKNSFQIVRSGTAVNYIAVEARPTGNSARVLAVGDDTNIDLDLVTKGTGFLNSGAPAALKANAFSTTVNFNSANTDHAIAIKLPTGFTRYRISNIVISGCSIALTTATWGLYTSTGAGGTSLISGAPVAAGITSASENTDGNMNTSATINTNTRSWTHTTLYFRVHTAQGSAATGTATININPVS